MSVFGGDSWSREAQNRKRRVDDLAVEGLDPSSYKKLSGGKYACLLCAQHPVLDTPLMLSMHMKGSRHRAAESRHKERQVMIQEEINKRVALSEGSACTGGSSTSTQVSQCHTLARKPLIEQTRRAASEILRNKSSGQTEAKGDIDSRSSKSQFRDGPSLSNNKASFISTDEARKFFSINNTSVHTIGSCEGSNPRLDGYHEAARKSTAEQESELRERQERELKFTEAGWKRDCHGKWFRDENIEFDSDEDDPNICLA